MTHFEKYRSYKSKQWKWRLRAANGEIVATCGRESYHNEIDCLHAIKLVQLTHSETPVEDAKK